MPKGRRVSLCMDTQRHAEYYGMQQAFDELYAESKAGEKFTDLMEMVLSQDNIMLAYRNIKTNTGRPRLSIRSEKLSQEVNTATGPNQCAEKKFQNRTAKQGRWVSPAFGTGWCSSASSKSWSQSARQNSATTAMGFGPTGQWSTQYPAPIPSCKEHTYTMFWNLTSRDSLTM